MSALLALFGDLPLRISPLFAADPEPESQPAPDPEVTITPPKSYKARRIFLFPLEIPYHVMRGVTYPIAQTGKFIERKDIARKAIDFFCDDERNLCFYPILSAGGGDGFGGGLGLKHSDLFNKGYRLSARYMVFSNLDQRASLSFGHPDVASLWNRFLSFRLSSNFRRESDEPFYGIGTDSLKSDKSIFRYQRIRAGATLGYELVSNLVLAPHAIFETVDTEATPSGRYPGVQQTFPPSDLPGFGERVSYINFGGQLTHDTRDDNLAPERGGIRTFRFSRFQGVNRGGFDYNEYELDVRQYIGLGRPRYVLALRNAWVFQQKTGGGQIPFYRLAALDLQHGLRGFTRGRFRDTASVVFNIEYRYPVWDMIDGSLFVDTGRVFSGPTHFSFKGFKYSVGGGIRVKVRQFVLFTIQAAYGGEGVNFVFRAGAPL